MAFNNSSFVGICNFKSGLSLPRIAFIAGFADIVKKYTNHRFLILKTMVLGLV